MGDISSVDCSMNNHNLSLQYCDYNNGDVISGNLFNTNPLSQCNYSSTFKEMGGYVLKGDVSSVYGFMNIYISYQLNGLKSFIEYNHMHDMEMNDNIQNGDVSSGIGLTNRHTLPQCNKSIRLNEMNWGSKNSYFSGGPCYMNSHTVSEANIAIQLIMEIK